MATDRDTRPTEYFGFGDVLGGGTPMDESTKLLLYFGEDTKFDGEVVEISGVKLIFSKK